MKSAFLRFQKQENLRGGARCTAPAVSQPYLGPRPHPRVILSLVIFCRGVHTSLLIAVPARLLKKVVCMIRLGNGLPCRTIPTCPKINMMCVWVGYVFLPALLCVVLEISHNSELMTSSKNRPSDSGSAKLERRRPFVERPYSSLSTRPPSTQLYTSKDHLSELSSRPVSASTTMSRSTRAGLSS